MFQIFMRPGTTEFAMMICFEIALYCKLKPLGHPEMLANPNLPFDVSFIYGTTDWMRMVE